jgi:hypothetical protein
MARRSTDDRQFQGATRRTDFIRRRFVPLYAMEEEAG